jgi:transketolase
MSSDVLAVGGRGNAKPSTASIDELCINTIRTLAMDAVQKAKSGHPGTPMALAPVAYALWQNVLRYDPQHPVWPNRDRFVLSNGHASMLLYALIHLAGIRDDRDGRSAPAVSLDDIKQFRQLGSRCPGHPEYRHTVGVETTTGPLGQGCGNSVGMAMAQRFLAIQFNRPDATLFDYDIYTFCSDGDMMEGISGEAASLAGHLRLSNLCWVYDNNQITIDGNTGIAFTEDVATRFRGYGFAVIHVGDANDLTALGQAFAAFRRTNDRPTLIIVDSHIAYGAPHKQDTSAAHGEPLGEEEVQLTKRAYGWPSDATFLVPDGVYEHFRAGLGDRGRQLHDGWAKTLATYRQLYPELAGRLDQLWSGDAPPGFDAELPVFPADPKGMASREAAGKVLDSISPRLPSLVGGSADLVASTKAKVAGGGDMSATQPGGRNIHFGVREHSMAAELSGLALSGLRPFGATFLIFSDYMKPSIRLAAMMQLPVIYVFTHDSIGLGEDGPTHQPIEQLAGLRAIPGLITLRPADANETVEAWRLVMALRDEPACLVLSRQALPTLDRTRFGPAAGLVRGAYVLADADGGTPDVILIGTGSEVSLCVEAQAALAAERIRARVVSMPSWELFARQDERYRESVLPQAVKARISVEAASVLGWERHVGRDGAMIGMHGFGTSSPGKEAMRHFGFTAQAVVAAARAQIAKWGASPSSTGPSR